MSQLSTLCVIFLKDLKHLFVHLLIVCVCMRMRVCIHRHSGHAMHMEVEDSLWELVLSL